VAASVAVRVYLARAVDELPRSAILERGRALAERLRPLGAQLVDPVASWDAGGEDSADLVTADLRNLRTCDVILMDMTIPDRNYIGCVCELMYAYQWQIPSVVWVGETGYDRRPWLRHHATAIVQNEHQAIQQLGMLLNSRRRAPTAE
jgi:nucleoside 2-deoxyribosyltransferase